MLFIRGLLVFLVTTKSGQTLRITGNHKVLTQRGWVAVDNLVSGSDFMITEELDGTLVDSVNKRRDLDVSDVVARRNHVKEQCVQCSATDQLECDHIVPVKSGGTHEGDNLQTLCASCHKEKSAKEKSPTQSNAFKPRWTQVLSVEPCGSEDVYDITVEGHHNFLANGLVVHNCVGGVWNEVSRRYVDSEPEFFLPEVFRGRPVGSIKQGSAGLVENVHGVSTAGVVRRASSTCLHTYNDLLAAGVAPEQARMVLPLNTHTEWIWTGSHVLRPSLP